MSVKDFNIGFNQNDVPLNGMLGDLAFLNMEHLNAKLTAVAQTSPTDTTAGAQMAVGAFGLGETITNVQTGNMDDQTRATGIFTFNTTTSTGTFPSGITDVQVWHRRTGGTAQQIAIASTIKPSRMFVRTWYSSSWSTWIEVATTDNISTVIAPAIATLVGSNGSTTALMGVGAFGLGLQTATLLSVDVNTIYTNGFTYHSSGSANLPIAQAGMILTMVGDGAAGQRACQTYISQSSDRLFFRRLVTGTWQAWVEILNMSQMYPAWTTVTYSNSWVGYDTTNYNDLQYRLEGKRVFLRGLVKNATASVTAVATLPVGYRPIKAKMLTSGSALSGGHTGIQINSAGVITPMAYGTANNPLCFDGLSFEID